MIHNNITRMLEAKKIEFTPFELPLEKLGALETAQVLGVSPALVYKSIIVVREKKGKPIIAVVPGPSKVDLKLLAELIGEKRFHIPTEKEAETLTGLQVGGISPLALLNRGFQMVLDDSAKGLERIYISGGQRGLNLLIKPDDLIGLINPMVAKITSN